MIYNGFIFYDEFDLLKIRLEELWDVVDKFILVESPVTHRNVKKPLFFNERKKEFKKYKSKIVHIIKDLPHDKNPWVLENEHRRGILDGCKDIKENDHLIVCDADEIPSAEAVKSFQGDIGHFSMDFYYYFYNYRADFKWTLAKMVRWGAMNFDINECRKHIGERIEGGWHFSKIMTLEQIKYKFRFALADDLFHDQIINNLDEWRKKGETHWCGYDIKFKKVEIDKTYPKYFLDNIEKYKNFIA